MNWYDKPLDEIVRNAHAQGCLDVLRAVLGQADLELDHTCLAVDWARRMWADPLAFDDFVQATQQAREQG